MAQFSKGQSGNPNGRPAGTGRKALTEALSGHVETAVETLVGLLNHSNANIRLRAAVEVLDRVFGKPGPSIFHEDDGEARQVVYAVGPSDIPTLEEIRAMAEERRRQARG